MSIPTSVKWPQYQIGRKPGQEEPPNFIYPVISLMELHARVVPYLWLIENERPQSYGVHVLREWPWKLPDLYLDFPFDKANGSILRIESG